MNIDIGVAKTTVIPYTETLGVIEVTTLLTMKPMALKVIVPSDFETVKIGDYILFDSKIFVKDHEFCAIGYKVLKSVMVLSQE